MTEELRSRVAAQIRRDLDGEMKAGFPLLSRFPNSEMAGIPDFVSRLSTAERESLLNALALYATLHAPSVYRVIKNHRKHSASKANVARHRISFISAPMISAWLNMHDRPNQEL